MLDTTLRDLADTMIGVQFVERREQLQREVLEIQEKMNARRLFGSSTHFDLIRDLCAREVSIRAQIVFQVYVRFVSKLAISSTLELGSDLKDRLQSYMPVGLGDIGDYMTKVSGFSHGRDVTLGEERSRALKRVGVEIDVFILSALKRKQQLERGDLAQPIYDVDSPVGVIQPGPSTSATALQTIVAEDREVLLRALEFLKESLARQGEGAGFPKQEALALVEESQTEVQRPKPNGLRLTIILTTVASYIQGVAGLHEAYQKLKTALLPYGILRP